jgi:hypothetical protein
LSTQWVYEHRRYKCESFILATAKATRVSRSAVCVEGCVGEFSIVSTSRQAACLKYICIFSSIETISPSSFSDCKGLLYVGLESGSKISVLCDAAFENCVLLRSIYVLSSIETISKACFSNCEGLSDLRFQSASGFRFSAKVPLMNVHRFGQFVCLHQFKQGWVYVSFTVVISAN